MVKRYAGLCCNDIEGRIKSLSVTRCLNRDLNFDKSYMTKKSQKPLYRTRFMLDELGMCKLPALM